MKRKTIDWDALVPLGLDGRKTARTIAAAVVQCAVGEWAVFTHSYRFDRNMLYENRPWPERPRLIEGAVMAPFYPELRGIFYLLAITALCMLPLALWFYGCHYQDGRSIYLMRRLPDRWELWRRCLALPLLGIAACALFAVLELLLCYATYWICTPRQCLQPGQWRMLWESLFE